MESGGALPIERAIVSVHLEEAQKALERERELELHFRSQWTRIEDYPACPAGLTLLRRFAEEYPQREVTEQPPLDLLRPYESDGMEMNPANPSAGNVRNNGPEMLNSA